MTDQLAPDDVGDPHGRDDVDDAIATGPEDGGSAGGASDRDAADDTDGDDGASGWFGGTSFGGIMERRRSRVSRWDRPPEPRDWRFYVRTLGKVLIAMGLLMFGFVAYQLWGTGIETARAQNRLENEFEQLLDEFAEGRADESATTDGGVTNDRDEPSVATGDDDPESVERDGIDPEGVDSDDGGSDGGEEGSADPDELDITVGDVTRGVPVAVDLSDRAVAQDPLPQPFRGDPLFRLEIPAIGRDDIVVAGVSLDDLKDGPGHYDDTPLPGQLGNAAIAGHRTTYGGPFFDVDELRAGDELITTLANGDRFVYEVTFIEVVEASDYWVVTTRDPNIAEMTLTSCHPKYTARQRIVVHSVLDPDRSSNVGLPTFYELEDDTAEPAEGDDPVLVANDIEITDPDSARAETDGAVGEVDERGSSDDAAAADDDAAAMDDDSDDDGDLDPTDAADATGAPTDQTDASDATAGGASTDDDGATAPAASDGDPTDGSTSPAATADDATDAFGRGWFEDRAAWPQIALWALALTIISLLAYQVSKRTRRSSIGFLVGVAPFLFALYFFYQNVHRLLPPGI